MNGRNGIKGWNTHIPRELHSAASQILKIPAPQLPQSLSSHVKEEEEEEEEKEIEEEEKAEEETAEEETAEEETADNEEEEAKEKVEKEA